MSDVADEAIPMAILVDQISVSAGSAVVTLITGGRLLRQFLIKGDAKQIADHVRGMAIATGTDRVWVDSIGVGLAVCQLLEADGIEVDTLGLPTVVDLITS